MTQFPGWQSKTDIDVVPGNWIIYILHLTGNLSYHLLQICLVQEMTLLLHQEKNKIWMPDQGIFESDGFICYNNRNFCISNENVYITKAIWLIYNIGTN